MLDLAGQEARLLEIQSELDSWYSLIPRCVTMSYTTSSYSLRNNGTCGYSGRDREAPELTVKQGLSISRTLQPKCFSSER